jgi:serine/threonine protein kinase
MHQQDFESPAVTQLRADLALALRAAAHHGLAEGVCNHFSVELPDHSGRFLLNPRGLLWSEITADDIVMIDEQGHLKITDFGLAKENVKKEDINKEFCGTISYLAPEILRNEGYTNSVDWYNFGTLIYTMLQVDPPFFALKKELIYHNIIHSPLSFKYSISNEAKDLISTLMDKNPKTRLADPNQIKMHPWFKGVNWEDALNRKMKVPKPIIKISHLVEEPVPYHEEDDDKSKHIDLLKTFIEQ